MKVEFKGSFVKDLKKIKEKQLQGQIRELIEKVEASAKITELESISRSRKRSNDFSRSAKKRLKSPLRNLFVKY